MSAARRAEKPRCSTTSVGTKSVRPSRLYFQIAYAAGMLLIGRLIDRLGTRGLRPGHGLLEHRIHDACRRGFLRQLRRRAFRPRSRGRRFPASIKCVAECSPKKNAPSPPNL